MLAANFPLVGPDNPLAAARSLDRDDVCLSINLRAALASAPRERLGEVGGLNVSVLGMLDRAQ